MKLGVYLDEDIDKSLPHQIISNIDTIDSEFKFVDYFDEYYLDNLEPFVVCEKTVQVRGHRLNQLEKDETLDWGVSCINRGDFDLEVVYGKSNVCNNSPIQIYARDKILDCNYHPIAWRTKQGSVEENPENRVDLIVILSVVDIPKSIMEMSPDWTIYSKERARKQGISREKAAIVELYERGLKPDQIQEITNLPDSYSIRDTIRAWKTW